MVLSFHSVAEMRRYNLFSGLDTLRVLYLCKDIIESMQRSFFHKTTQVNVCVTECDGPNENPIVFEMPSFCY